MSEVPPLGSLLDLGCRLMMHRSHLLYCAAGGRADDIPRSPEGTTWRALPPFTQQNVPECKRIATEGLIMVRRSHW